ncbi:unnamed protein product, partial [Phaeothamnion confervicola]
FVRRKLNRGCIGRHGIYSDCVRGGGARRRIALHHLPIVARHAPAALRVWTLQENGLRAVFDVPRAGRLRRSAQRPGRAACACMLHLHERPPCRHNHSPRRGRRRRQQRFRRRRFRRRRFRRRRFRRRQRSQRWRWRRRRTCLFIGGRDCRWRQCWRGSRCWRRCKGGQRHRLDGPAAAGERRQRRVDRHWRLEHRHRQHPVGVRGVGVAGRRADAASSRPGCCRRRQRRQQQRQ